ncbi:hypothetical protein [Nonomuraea jabiensis]|uniref:Uncharacterized protein n=1 Tax=Nonomuraea jabiensis TaxID=882448 RepID=A0A7W9GCP0_9ACTN|nr:hypothetical protein [Nonomuraea jabiensis]
MAGAGDAHLKYPVNFGVGVSQPYGTEIGHRGGPQVFTEAELEGTDADLGRGGDVGKGDAKGSVLVASTPGSNRSRFLSTSSTAANGTCIIRTS